VWFVLLVFLLVACSNTMETSPAAPTQDQMPVVQEFNAALTAHEGTVTVNGIPVVDGMELKEGDVVKTEDESEAEVILYGSSRVRVWDNTTLRMQRLTGGSARSVQLQEEAGKIWARVLRVSGINQYEVITPNTVASVRGTGFWVSFGNDSTRVGVTDGKVFVQHVENGSVTAQKTMEKEEQMVVDAQMSITPLEHDDFIDENVQKDAEFMKVVRERMGAKKFDALMNSSGSLSSS